MNIEKRHTLIERLKTEQEPQLVPIDIFFDGNDDLGSIGCNLLEHPGIEAFRATFARLSAREDVDAVFARIAEVDPGDDCWPFTDTVFVVGTITVEDLASELSALEPDEIGTAEDFGAQEALLGISVKPALAAWWD